MKEKVAEMATNETEAIVEAMSAKRAQGQGVSAEEAAKTLGADLTALAPEAAEAEAMAAEKVRVKE